MKTVTVCLILTVLVSFLDLASGRFLYNLLNNRGRLQIGNKNKVDVDYLGCPRKADRRFHRSQLYENEDSDDCTSFVNCGQGRTIQKCSCYIRDVDGTCKTYMRFKPQLHSCATPGMVKCKRNKEKASDEQ